MAYRFLLEVPASLAADANAAVTDAGDAQVVVERPGHGLGFDETHVDLTVAAHSLRIVDTIYAWAADVGATRSDSRAMIGIVLLSGKRLNVAEVDRAGLIAAIRRDQPWVERAVPKIGDHERVQFAVGSAGAAAQQASVAAAALAVAERPASAVVEVDYIDAEDEVNIGSTTYAVMQVMNLAHAERFYHETLGLDIVRRMRQDDRGEWQELGADYDHETASHTLTEADLSFMSSGPLNIALSRAGRAAYLDYNTVMNELHITLEPTVAARLNALVLTRNYTLLDRAGRSFTFRDPFGVVWNVRAGDAS